MHFLLSLKCFMADQIVAGHSNETRTHAKSISEAVLLPFHPRRQIAKRTGGVVKEKNANERGKKKRGESGVNDDHKHIRMMKPLSDIAIERGKITGRQVVRSAKFSHERKVHIAHSRVMRANG
jgi:hypothetical protein